MVTRTRKLNPRAKENTEESIRMCPFPNGRELASLRQHRDGDMASLPYILDCNIPYQNQLLTEMAATDYDMKDVADQKELSKRIKESANDPVKEKELADFRKFTFSSDIMPSPFALSMFQVVDLAEDENPMIETPRSRNLQRFTVRTMSYDGTTLMNQWRTTKDALTLELETLATEKVSYQLIDIRQGNISAYNDVNTELKFDMDMKIDSLARAGADAAATASGLRALLNLHPAIVAANLPDKNYLDLSGVDVSGVLSIGKLKTILDYVALLTSAFPQEGLQLRSVFMSPQNLRDAWDFTSLVSGLDGVAPTAPKDTVPSSVRDQIFATGGFMNAWGFKMNWVPNAQGKMYFTFNKPIGWCFTKRSLDRILKWDESNSMDHAEANYGELMYKKVMAFYRPDLWKYRILVVQL